MVFWTLFACFPELQDAVGSAGNYTLNNVVIVVTKGDEKANLLFGAGIFKKFSDWSYCVNTKEAYINLSK